MKYVELSAMPRQFNQEQNQMLDLISPFLKHLCKCNNKQLFSSRDSADQLFVFVFARRLRVIKNQSVQLTNTMHI